MRVTVTYPTAPFYNRRLILSTPSFDAITSARAVGVRLEQSRLDEGARRQREIEPAEIATAASVSQSTVSQWLKGKKRPSLANALRVAPLLGTTAEWLLLERGNRYAAPPSVEDAPPIGQRLQGRYRSTATPKKPGKGEQAS